MDRVATPVGAIWLVARRERIWGAELEPRAADLAIRLLREGVDVEPGTVRGRRAPVLSTARRALRTYFEGDLKALEAVPLALEGSELQRSVWRRVRRIRAGRTLSYKALAEAVGHEGAFRAIGRANGSNPTALFVPCHRIVSSDGRLQGYGAGLDAKAWLLAHEGVKNDGVRLMS